MSRCFRSNTQWDTRDRAPEATQDGMHRGFSAEIQAQDEAGPAQRAGPAVPSLLLPAAGAAAVHTAPKQVK